METYTRDADKVKQNIHKSTNLNSGGSMIELQLVINIEENKSGVARFILFPSVEVVLKRKWSHPNVSTGFVSYV